jgi:hypothetical protein
MYILFYIARSGVIVKVIDLETQVFSIAIYKLRCHISGVSISEMKKFRAFLNSIPVFNLKLGS